MIATGIGFLSGILLALFEPRLVDVFWLSWLPVCVAFAVLPSPWRIAWVVASGFLWSTLHAHWQLGQRLPGELNNKRVTVVGEVVNIPRRYEHGSRFMMRLEAGHAAANYRGLVRLFWRAAPQQLAVGQRWKLRVKLRQPHGFQNPGGFDYERWLFSRGVGATGYVVKDSDNSLLRQAPPGLTALRSRIHELIRGHCQDCGQGGLIQALSIGYRGDIDQEHRSLLQRTGTAHLIAISGLHIGIIAGWFYLVGQWTWNRWLYRRRLNRREFGLSLGWSAALLYSLLSGFDLPAQRAMLMLSVIVAAQWLRLPVNLLGSVVIALIAVLLVTPLAVLSASFWLTFCALLVICLSLLLFRESASPVMRLLQLQLMFSLLFTPLSILIFGQVHAASLIANLVAVPLVSLVIVPFNFILLLLQWLPADWLELLYAGEDYLLGVLLAYLRLPGEWGLEALSMAHISTWRLLMIGLFVLLLVLPRGAPAPRGWLLLLALVFWLSAEEDAPHLRVAVLDVGMGTSVVVNTPHHSLVYDFGAGNDRGYSLGQWVVMPYLRGLGVAHVDRVVISHADQDHLGGYLGIRHELDHGPVYTGTLAETRQKLPAIENLLDCHEMPGWRWDGVDFRFVSADVEAGQSENDRSCVLQIVSASNRILVAGDIETRQESRLLNLHREELAADILVAPHHGSLTSSSPGFIDVVNPALAIFTAGYLNRWRFPREEVLQRYRDRGVRIVRTDRDGAVLIECGATACSTRLQRRQRPRLWY